MAAKSQLTTWVPDAFFIASLLFPPALPPPATTLLHLFQGCSTSKYSNTFMHLNALLVVSRLPVLPWLAKGKLQPQAELFARLCLAFKWRQTEMAASAHLPSSRAVPRSRPVTPRMRARRHSNTLSCIPTAPDAAKPMGKNWYSLPSAPARIKGGRLRTQSFGHQLRRSCISRKHPG